LKATSVIGFFSSKTVFVLSSFGCFGHLSGLTSHSGPLNQPSFPILSIEAPQLPKSAKYSSDGQYFQPMPTSSVILAIFRVRFDTKTFQDLSGLAIQNKATRLSIHTATDAIGHLLNAATKFLAILAAI
jgi:hypothetical protein